MERREWASAGVDHTACRKTTHPAPHAAPHPWDLILLDLGLPDSSGPSGVRRLHEACPGASILVIAGDDDPTVIDETFALGARGYLPKNPPGAALSAAVDTVMRGELYVPPHVLPSYRRESQRAPAPPALADDLRLTPRQVDVLKLLAWGLVNKEIADALEMSASTVRVHVSAILRALGVENRTQAATHPLVQRLLKNAESR